MKVIFQFDNGKSYTDAIPEDEPIEGVKWYISVRMDIPQYYLEFRTVEDVDMDDDQIIQRYFEDN
ncbi:hypothetical protein GGI23_002192, partial [Coemansia sp. RSA 2559]